MRAIIAFIAAPLLAASCQVKAESACSQTVPVNVRDRQGKLVVGLQPSTFRATFRGKQLKVQSTKVDLAPRRIVLLLDLSRSMTESRATWEMARLIATDLVSSAGTGNSVALMTFASTVIETVNFSSQPSDITQRLGALQNPEATLPKHGRTTALFDAVAKAAMLFNQPLPGDTIYVISDGGESHSRLDANEIKRLLVARGIRLFAFVVIGRSIRTDEEKNGPPLMKELAEVTGGAVGLAESGFTGGFDLSGKGRARLSASLNAIYDEVENFYQLQVEIPISNPKPHPWKIEVLAEDGQKRKDLRLIYPHLVAPCSVQSAHE